MFNISNEMFNASNVSISTNVSFFNFTYVDPLPIFYYIIVGILATIGWFGSLTVISISAFSKELKGDFKYFVANVALIGLLTESVWILSLLCKPFYFNPHFPFVLFIIVSIAEYGN